MMQMLTNFASENTVENRLNKLAPGSSPPDSSENDDHGRMLDGYRQYLLMIANEVIGPELQAKLDASDLVQDTFLEAQKHLAIFRGKTRFELRAWLRKILECRLANIRRTYLVTEMRSVNREVTLDLVTSEPGGWLESVKSEALSPSNNAARNESALALEQALERLPEKHRHAVIWRHQEQLSWDEIGQRMGCTPGAARKVWCRAIQLLRRELAAHESIP
jgi:RNA polymerase sigma-70 factor (ECF subfamily)